MAQLQPSDQNPYFEIRPGQRFPLPFIQKKPSFHWFVVGTVCVGAFMAALDASIVNVALPTLERSFHVSLSVVEWVSLVYLLTLASLIVPLGRLADMFGRRGMYAGGFSVFVIGSVTCGLSTSMWMLLTARVVQAAGAAMLQANSVSIITAATPLKARGKAIGIQGSAQALGLTLGPFLGGLLLQSLNWKWIFFINLPVGIVGTLLGILMLPKTEAHGRHEKFDYAGSIILAPTLVGLIYFFNSGPSRGWTSPLTLISLVVAVVGFTLFMMVESRKENPLVDLTLFRSPTFSIGNFATVLSFAVMYGVSFLGPFYLDHIKRYNSLHIGLIMTAIPIAMSILTPIAGGLADNHGARIFTVSGMLSAALGCGMLSIGIGGADLLFIVGLAFVGMGLGLFTPPNNSGVMSSSPQNRLGVAGGILNMSRTLGMQLGVTLGGLSYELFLKMNAGHGVNFIHDMTISYREAYLFIGVMAVIAAVLSLRDKAKILES